MIDLDILDKEYSDYKIVKSLYEKYKNELYRFTSDNKDEIEESVKQYEEILKTKNMKELENKVSDLKDNDPVFAEWLDIYSCVEFYDSELKSRKTYACENCGQVIKVHSVHTGENYLVDIHTGEIFDLEKYSKNKQNYIIEDLFNNNLFVGTISSKDLPLFKILLDDIHSKGEEVEYIVGYDKKLVKNK